MIDKTFITFLFSIICAIQLHARETLDFNDGWEFLLDHTAYHLEDIDQMQWESVSLPHDWSVELGYSKEHGACSTGFTQGGLGWYRKSFSVSAEDKDKVIRIEFDGIYNHSTVWVNGRELGYRPYGYSSFSYDLTDCIKFGEFNEIIVRVDRTQYADSRWYTGSGIYRNVRLVKSHQIHIPQWGVQVSTPHVSSREAKIRILTKLKGGHAKKDISVNVSILNTAGVALQQDVQEIQLQGPQKVVSEIQLADPVLWDLDHPHMYRVKVQLFCGNDLLDETIESFGIRSIRYDANKGFFLNDNSVKIKGVNLHHDAGAFGAAVPKDIWYSRVRNLKSMGCNAIRMAHNPHSPELMQACDELGVLVMAEAFDEWDVPKGKSLAFLSDNAAPDNISKSYPEYFNEWCERDLRDLVRRDFNHPCVIMWSIGNEIAWTYDYYHKSVIQENNAESQENVTRSAVYDEDAIRKKMAVLLNGKKDRLTEIAKQLSAWVREEDTTRFITCGSVRPSVAFATGYADTVDIFGMNYRAIQYDLAHKTYPDAKIMGSENWGSWQEWQNVNSRDFVGGIFVWTGFAYLGEAGPWPRKGLNISFFDYTGVLTPRGHMYKSMWKNDPEVFLETIPLKDSEYSYSEKEGWVFQPRTYDIPRMTWLRKWEWTESFRHWNYEKGENILIQAYTNCPEAELFLNGKSLGVRKLKDFDDGRLKWIVPFITGKLKLVGLKNGERRATYEVATAGEIAQIKIKSDRIIMNANKKDIVQIWAQAYDKQGNPVYHDQQNIQFKHRGPATLVAVDNGSEYNVQSHLDDNVETFEGRAYAAYQASEEVGELQVLAISGGIQSNAIKVSSR